MDGYEGHDAGLGLLFWSALVIMVGFLIAIFGATLRNQRQNQGYSDALHASIPPGIIIVIGLVVAIFGVFGIVLAIMRRGR